MADRENITISIWVHPDTYLLLFETLAILDDLELDNQYKITPSDFNISETPMTNWLQFNIPVALYLTFKLKLQES